MEYQDELHLDDETSMLLINLSESMEKLSKKKPELAKMVQLKFVVGLAIDEIADLLGCSSRSADRKRAMANNYQTSV